MTPLTPEQEMDRISVIYNLHIDKYEVPPTDVYVSRSLYKSWCREFNLNKPKNSYEIIKLMGMNITARDSFHDPILSSKAGMGNLLNVTTPRKSTDFLTFLIGQDSIDFLVSCPSIHERGSSNLITLVTDRYFEDGSLYLDFKINGISIRKTSTSMFPFDGDMSVTRHFTRAYEAHKSIPLDAVLIPKDQLQNFNGKLIAGWLFDSRCKVYGIKAQNGNIQGYDCAINWIPTPEELRQLTDYPKLSTQNQGEQQCQQ